MILSLFLNSLAIMKSSFHFINADFREQSDQLILSNHCVSMIGVNHGLIPHESSLSSSKFFGSLNLSPFSTNYRTDLVNVHQILRRRNQETKSRLFCSWTSHNVSFEFYITNPKLDRHLTVVVPSKVRIPCQWVWEEKLWIHRKSRFLKPL
jgi:hypothetical protein